MIHFINENCTKLRVKNHIHKVKEKDDIIASNNKINSLEIKSIFKLTILVYDMFSFIIY